MPAGACNACSGVSLGDIRTWYGNAGFARSLSRQLSFNFTYGYVARQTASTGNAIGMTRRILTAPAPGNAGLESSGE